MEWVADSACWFYPLVEHDASGLALHPFDLATNKVLALVGRVEARDWVDVGACGKDPGFTPHGILEQAARSARCSEDEIAELTVDYDLHGWRWRGFTLCLSEEPRGFSATARRAALGLELLALRKAVQARVVPDHAHHQIATPLEEADVVVVVPAVEPDERPRRATGKAQVRDLR